MAFTENTFYLVSAGFPENVTQRVYSYKSADAMASIKASGYFDDAHLEVNDLIYAGGSDDRELLYVASIDPVVTADLVAASAGTVPDGSITTAKLADSAVTYAKLSSDITGVKAAHSGAATPLVTSSVFTVAGTTTNDVALATLTAGFSQPIVGTVCTADTVTVHFQAAPLVTDIVEILVIGAHND